MAAYDAGTMSFPMYINQRQLNHINRTAQLFLYQPLQAAEIIWLCTLPFRYNQKRICPRLPLLIYTTHDTTLLDKKFFRRDQVWFVQKDEYGCSQL